MAWCFFINSLICIIAELFSLLHNVDQAADSLLSDPFIGKLVLFHVPNQCRGYLLQTFRSSGQEGSILQPQLE